MATGFNTRVGDGEYCLQFETDNREYYLLMQETARRCVDGKPTTNAQKIRSMSDEELAEFIDRCEMNDIDYAKTFCDLCNGQYECDQCRLDWLKQPAE